MAAADPAPVAKPPQAAVVLANAKGVVKFASPAMARFAPGDGGVVAGATLDSLFQRGDAKRVLDALAKITAEVTQSAFIDVHTAGTGIAVRLELQLALDARQKPSGIIAVLHPDAGEGMPLPGGDATRTRLVEKAGAELSLVLEGVSALGLRAQQLELDAALVAQFQAIRASTVTALAAIGGLLDSSEAQGAIALNRDEFHLRVTLAELVGRVVHTAGRSRNQLHVKVGREVPDLLEGDRERLQLLLHPLLERSIAAFPGTDVTLSVVPVHETAERIGLAFAVTVDGFGRSGTGEAPESGSGVAVAGFMVAAMGGQLALGSGPSEPLYAFELEFALRPPVPAPPRPTYVSLTGLRALVVSEDKMQRHELTKLLRGWRLTPLEADNAEMAFALLERLATEGKPVPLVLVPSRMRVQDGFLLAFRLTHDPRLTSTRVMMLAAEGRPGDALACQESGIAAYLSYPLADRQLYDAIVSVTGASEELDETPTLVTRHSLREQRRGATILVVDENRENHFRFAHLIRKRECSLSVAETLTDALTCLAQDIYDFVFVDTSVAGLDGPGAAARLREHMARDPEATRIYAFVENDAFASRMARLAEDFDGTLARPVREEDLLAILALPGEGAAPAG